MRRRRSRRPRKFTKAGLRASESIRVQLMEPELIITSAAGERKADLIVLGSHGRRGFNRLLLGSVCERVALRSDCSVEVVRATPARKLFASTLPAEAQAQTPVLAHC